MALHSILQLLAYALYNNGVGQLGLREACAQLCCIVGHLVLFQLCPPYSPLPCTMTTSNSHAGGRHHTHHKGGKARQGKARQGKARQGKARQGKARQGKARQGKARQGKARQGRQGKGREGKGRQGKGREGKGRQGKGTLLSNPNGSLLRGQPRVTPSTTMTIQGVGQSGAVGGAKSYTLRRTVCAEIG